MEILELSIKSLKNLIKIAKICNKNSITDIGVALYMLYASAKGSAMNVIVNANELDIDLKSRYIEQIEYHINEGEDLFSKTNDIINSILK